MFANEKFRFSDAFYENLGDLKSELVNARIVDSARFYLAAKFIKGNNILDIGTYWCDFLNIARKKVEHIYGTEINQLRCNSANKKVGKPVVRVDFRHGKLNSFENNSIDTVVCMEVLEHVDDLEGAVSEIIRVARKRIIITVPYNQTPQYYLCIHCNKLTPQMNHLHKFDELKLRDLFKTARKVDTFKFGHSLLYRSFFRSRHLPLSWLIALDCLISRFRHSGSWMFAIIDK
jgi:ubiquinone/menaquinone biosynthesis C-methylase UbiE